MAKMIPASAKNGKIWSRRYLQWPNESTESKFSQRTAITLVIANMVGTGVFTSSDFSFGHSHAGIILLLWLIGDCGPGKVSCGTGVALPRSGGE